MSNNNGDYDVVMQALEDGKVIPAELQAVCEWVLATYPRDVFVGKDRGSRDICILRDSAENILYLINKKKKEART